MISEFLRKIIDRIDAVKSQKENKLPDSSVEEKSLPWYKRRLVRKIGYFLVALLIATTLWGYVLMSENPERSIRIEGIKVSFEAGSEADLYARNLTILGDLNEILPEVTVTIKTTLNDLPKFSGERAKDIVKATVSLNSVHVPGEHTLNINATTSVGEIDKLSIDKLVINVDDLVSRSIPVTASVQGTLPDGYWNSEPQLLTNSITIKGAESEIVNIVKANCIIDLTGRTESINDSMSLVLCDKFDMQIPYSSIVGTIPSVTVMMDILPERDITLEANIIGQNALKDIYEIASISVSPSILSVAGDDELLSDIVDLVSLEPIDVSNASTDEPIIVEVGITGLPDGVIITNSVTTVIVTIEIRERVEEVTFEAVPVKIINADNTKFNYVFEPTTCIVTLSGKASVIRSLYSWQIDLTLNMSGYGAGVHSLIPELQIAGSPELLQVLTIDISHVTCTITNANH